MKIISSFIITLTLGSIGEIFCNNNLLSHSIINENEQESLELIVLLQVVIKKNEEMSIRLDHLEKENKGFKSTLEKQAVRIQDLEQKNQILFHKKQITMFLKKVAGVPKDPQGPKIR